METKATNVAILSALAGLLILAPLFIFRGAQFEGSDGAGSEMVQEVTGGGYEPWFEPVMEMLIGSELPGEMETLFFCIQTGIGVGIIAFCFGYLVARKKYGHDVDQKQASGRKAAAQENRTGE